MPEVDGLLDVVQVATPPWNPASGRQLIYPKADGYYYTKDSGGTEYKLGRDSEMVKIGAAAGGGLAGTYPNPTLAPNSVGASQITDGSVGNAELAPNAVDSSKIADGTIQATDLAFAVPDDSLVLHKAGAESITGTKTYTVPFVQTQIATPAAPPAGQTTGPYFKGDGLPYYRDAGGEHPFATSTPGGDLGVGSIMPWPTATAPTGWLLCDGRAVSRTGYPDLYAVIGTTFGTGDGSTTFNLPDLAGRTPLGVGTPAGAAGGTAHTLAQKGGEETHVLTYPELAAHNHEYQYSTSIQSLAGYFNNYAANASWTASSGWNPQNATGQTGTGGTNNQPHNNLPPYLGLNFVIRAIPPISATSANAFARGTGDLVNWGTTFTLVPGLTATVTVANPAQVLAVSLVLDVISTSTIVYGSLYVDGVQQPGITFASNINGRADLAEQWRLTGLSIGSHTIEFRAQCNSGNTCTISGGNSSLDIQTVGGGGGGGGGNASGQTVASPALTAGVWTAVSHGLGVVIRDVTFSEAASGESRLLDWRVVSGSTTQIQVRCGADKAAAFYNCYMEA